MEVKEIISNVQKKIKEMKRDSDFKKKQKFDEWKKKYSFALIECGGDLKVCEEKLAFEIEENCNFIKQAEEEGHYSGIVENMLEDCVIAYLEVRECKFALSTVSSYDAVNRIDEMIDIAKLKILGHNAKPKLGTFMRRPERNAYEYLNSEAQQKEYEEIFKKIKPDLLKTGDIKKCIKNYNKGLYSKNIDQEHYTQTSHAEVIFPDDDRIDTQKINFGGYNENDLMKDAQYNVDPPKINDVEKINDNLEPPQINTEPPKVNNTTDTDGNDDE